MCTCSLGTSEYMHVLPRYFFIPEFVRGFLRKNGKAVCFDSEKLMLKLKQHPAALNVKVKLEIVSLSFIITVKLVV